MSAGVDGIDELGGGDVGGRWMVLVFRSGDGVEGVDGVEGRGVGGGCIVPVAPVFSSYDSRGRFFLCLYAFY